MNPKPFAGTAGRDLAHDQATGSDVARHYYEQRGAIAADLPRLRELMAAIDNPNDLSPAQWAQWYSVALGFRPDLIIELGRGRGNSTAVFGQAAARLGDTRVVSLCMSPDWDELSRPRLQKVVDQSWLDRIDARVVDILAVDYAEVLGNAKRVLLVWDAHGFEIAELVLGDFLPRLAGRSHLVLMHDISDNRYSGAPRSYEGQPLWKGSHWQQRTQSWGSRVNIGWMNSVQDQVIALADFSARNDLAIGSADHEYATYFSAQPEYRDEMARLLGAEFFSLTAHWAFLSLEGRQPPFHFPPVAALRTFAGSCSVALKDTAMPGAEPVRLPFDVVTPAAQWAYGATLAWTPQAPTW